MSDEDARRAAREAQELRVAFDYAMSERTAPPPELTASGAAAALEVFRTTYGQIIDHVLPACRRLATTQAAWHVATENNAPKIVRSRLWQDLEAAAEALDALSRDSEWKGRDIPEVIRSYLKLLELAAETHA